MGDGAELVGRERELDRLTSAFDAARRGQGRVVSVSGEPGVGKTAVTRAFAADCSAQGATTLWGTCFEGAAQPAYGPWAAALAPLGVELIPSAADLSAPEARLRRWAAVGGTVKAAAGRAPVVVVLDDLQWASTETLDLLVYLAARAGESALLLVTTHRDPDPALQGGTALTIALADLARSPDHTAIALRGLDVAGVGAYLRGALGDDVPGAIVRAVHDHTGGNPFYVREVAEALVEEGKLVHRGGRWSTDLSLPALGIPATVRHAVGGRLARLGRDTQALLQAASVFSGDLALDLVQDVAGLDEERALDALDEALATGFLHRAPAGRPDAPYAFTHAIVRDVLAEALSPDRAARQHRRAAHALEARRPGEHAAIAEQYWLSRALPGAEAGVAHCLEAANVSEEQHASRHAVRLLTVALDLAPADDRSRRSHVLGRLAVAQAADLDAEAAPTTTLRALEGVGAEPAAELVVRVAEALREGAPPPAWLPLVQRGLQLVGDERGPAWARLAVLVDPVDTVTCGALRVGRWRCYPPDAVAALHATGREDDAARAIDPFQPRTETETQALVGRAASWTSPRPRMRALDLAGRDLSLRHGRPQAALDCYLQLLDLGERVGSMPAQAEAHAQLALCLALAGDLPRADEHLAASASLVANLWPGHRLHLLGTVASGSVVAYLSGRGDFAGLGQRLHAWLQSSGAASAPFANVFAALAATCDAFAGENKRARRALADLAGVLEAMDPFDHAVAGSLWFAAAAVQQLGDRNAAGRLAPLTARHLADGGPPGPAAVEHAAGRLAAVLGRPDEASNLLEQARRATDATGSHAVRALVDFDLAVLRNDLAGVADARRAFATMGMVGWVARAAAPPPSPARPSGLTAREAEVLRLLAAGRTSGEIARELVVAPATVNRHIANIYVKIGARNRAEATGFAITHGLAGP